MKLEHLPKFIRDDVAKALQTRDGFGFNRRDFQGRIQLITTYYTTAHGPEAEILRLLLVQTVVQEMELSAIMRELYNLKQEVDTIKIIQTKNL